MSREAQDWAAARVELDPSARWVLWQLADGAGGSGKNGPGEAAFYSAETISEKLNISIRRVRHWLAELEKLGYIERGDQLHVLHYPANRRPVVWNLCLWITHIPGVSPTTPQKASRGVVDGRLGVSSTTPNPRTNPLPKSTTSGTQVRPQKPPVDNSAARGVTPDPPSEPLPPCEHDVERGRRYCALCRRIDSRRGRPAYHRPRMDFPRELAESARRGRALAAEVLAEREKAKSSTDAGP